MTYLSLNVVLPKKKGKKDDEDLPISTKITTRCILEEHEGPEHRFSIRDEIKNVTVE